MLAVLQRRTSDVPAQKCDGKIISKHPVHIFSASSLIWIPRIFSWMCRLKPLQVSATAKDVTGPNYAARGPGDTYTYGITQG